MSGLFGVNPLDQDWISVPLSEDIIKLPFGDTTSMYLREP